MALAAVLLLIKPQLVRRLRDCGADVRVAMTEAAKAFITPLSLQAVSGYPVSDSLLDPAAEAHGPY
ncbi:flavoprotein [Escherichia coli]